MAGRSKTKTKKASSASRRRGRSGIGVKLLYVLVLVALGATLGVVLGAITETPRVVLSWVRGPVDRVEDVATQTVVDVEDTTLEEFQGLQKTRPFPAGAPRPLPPVVSSEPAPKPRPAAEAPPKPVVEAIAPVKPRPRAAAPKLAPPAAVASGPKAPRSAEEIIAQLAKTRTVTKIPGRAQPVSVAPKPAQKKPAPKASTQKRGRVVQIAAHARSRLAEEQAASLRASGFDAYVSTSRPSGSKSRYRVRVRPSPPETAKELVTRLRARGLDTWTTSE